MAARTKKKHKLYVYGTLRPGKVDSDIHYVPGKMYDLGYFPGITIDTTEKPSTFIRCELIELDDEGLAQCDKFECYMHDDIENSLYLRVPYGEGWIYLYNDDMSKFPVVECGDWYEYENRRMKDAAEAREDLHDRAQRKFRDNDDGPNYADIIEESVEKSRQLPAIIHPPKMALTEDDAPYLDEDDPGNIRLKDYISTAYGQETPTVDPDFDAAVEGELAMDGALLIAFDS